MIHLQPPSFHSQLKREDFEWLAGIGLPSDYVKEARLERSGGQGLVSSRAVPSYVRFELNKNATVCSNLNASSLDNSFRRNAERQVMGSFSVAQIRKENDGNRFQAVNLPT
ncbi:hypothetical protein Tco_0836688, partial [Tanacetum coccineum]